LRDGYCVMGIAWCVLRDSYCVPPTADKVRTCPPKACPLGAILPTQVGQKKAGVQ